jgi:non-ribosomal peptide synthase protein (TIGR01720 family)
MYGITETTVHVTYRPLRAEDLAGGRSVIGRTIPDLELYILDGQREPVPVGVPGELYVGGAGVARGYLNRPELTEERFVRHPWHAGARLYRTGDLARYLPNGDIEYLGRIDQQVKIRGHRIELGEIETALTGHAAIRDAVVLARGEGTEKRLVAYLIGESERRPTVSELRNELKAVLPEYMVPAAYVYVDAFPLTANGKLDTRALPAPDESRPELERGYVAPRTPAEEQLAAIWAELLHLEQVGIHDNFFELGGDSLLLMHAVSRTRQRGLEVRAEQFFSHLTISELAANLAGSTPIDAEQDIVSGPVPITPSQRPFLHVLRHPQSGGSPLGYRQLEVSRPLQVDLLTEAARALLDHHDALRLRVLPEGDDFRQYIDDREEHEIVEALSLGPLDVDQQEEAIARIGADLVRGLDLEHGPHVRIGYVALGPDRLPRLLVATSHLVVDDLTRDFLLEDLETAYLQRERGEDIHLLRKTTSFKVWAERLQGYARSPEVQRETEYWLEQPWDQISSFPMDGPMGESGRQVYVNGWLSEEDTTALLHRMVPTHAGGARDILLGAVFHAVSSWSGLPAISFDMRGHGREPLFAGVEVSRTAGSFMIWYPLLLRGEGADTPLETIRSVHDQLNAVPNNGIGYGVLRHRKDDRGVRAALMKVPRPQMTFNYLGQFQRTDQAMPLLRPVIYRRDDYSMLPTVPMSDHLNVVGRVQQGRLFLRILYHDQAYRQETVQALVDSALDTMRSLGRGSGTIASSASMTPLSSDQSVSVKPHREPVGREVPLTPSQLVWLTERPQHVNRPARLFLPLSRSLDSQLLRRALDHVVDVHPALRARFIRSDQGWRQYVAPTEDQEIFTTLDVRDVPVQDRRPRMRQAIEEAANSITLDRGPALRVGYLVPDADLPPRLAWIFNHLVADGFSMQVALEDLETAYLQMERGEEVRVPGEITSLETWAQRLQEYAQSPDLRADAGYWLTRPWEQTAALPLDGGGRPSGRQDVLRVQLDPEASHALLHAVPRRHRLGMQDLLLAALLRAVSARGGSHALAVDLRSHGREPLFPGVDVTRTVGWFATSYPVLLELPDRGDELLESVKEQVAVVPHGGIGYSALRNLSSDQELGDALHRIPTPRISLNYLGQFDHVVGRSSLVADHEALFGRVLGRPTSGEDEADMGGWAEVDTRPDIEIVALVYQSQIAVDLRFHREAYRPEAMASLIEDVTATLRSFTGDEYPLAFAR